MEAPCALALEAAVGGPSARQVVLLARKLAAEVVVPCVQVAGCRTHPAHPVEDAVVVPYVQLPWQDLEMEVEAEAA